jgi:enoyl-CoA hydratase/carnithine racemase
LLSYRHIPAAAKHFSSQSGGGGAELPSLVTVQHDALPDGSPSGVAIVAFNSPASLNNLTVTMGQQFEATIAALSLLPSLRAVVLTGQGKSFSAGGDLKFLQERAADSPINNAVTMRAFYRRFLSLRTLPVPVVAAVNGSAIGAGFAVALACDMRLYADDSKVGLTFTQLGLHPGMGSTHFLPALIGHEKAARMLLTGEVVSGPQAVALGLGLESVPAPQLLPHALDLARRIAANSSAAVKTLARSMRMRSEIGLEAALQVMVVVMLVMVVVMLVMVVVILMMVVVMLMMMVVMVMTKVVVVTCH